MANRVAPRAALPGSSGFSMVELLVVLAFIGILVGVGIPLVSEQVKQANVRQAADNMAADMRAARMIAVAKHADIPFNAFNSSTTCNSTAMPYCYQYTKSDGTTRTVNLPAGVIFKSGFTSALTFNKDGTVSASGNIKLQVPVSGATEQWTLKVNTMGRTDLTHQRL